MSDSDDLTLTLTPPPAATYYAGAPFYRPNVRAANPGENRPRHWPNISLESLYIYLGVVPPRALVDVRYPPNPPRVDGGFSPPTNEERLRRAMTAEELAAPLVTPAGTNPHLWRRVRGLRPGRLLRRIRRVQRGHRERRTSTAA